MVFSTLQTLLWQRSRQVSNITGCGILKHFLEPFVDLLNNHSSFVFTAIEKMDLGALKEVSCFFFLSMLKPNVFFRRAERKLHLFSTQLQSLIKIDFCSTSDYHDEGCSTAVMFNLGNEINFLIGVSICTRSLIH